MRAPATVTSEVLTALRAAVGPAGILEEERDIAPYCRSWRDDWEGRVACVVRPASTAETAEVVRICAAAGIGIVPQGGNTSLAGGAQPSADLSEVIVSMSRMRRIRELDPINDTVTVEAGAVLKDIQAAADAENRLFPLSLGAEGSCEIGGNVATNAGGVQVLRYGTMRQLVLGLEVVLADGSVWGGLRGLRKDNTGYDLKQLFIGAEGTLGVITAATLRLFPKPTATETAFIALDGPAAGVALLGHMRQRVGEAISAFELIGRPIIDCLLEGVPGHEDPMREAYPWYVLVDVASQGAPGSLHEPLSSALADALERGIIRDAQIAASGAQAKKLWSLRESLPEAQLAAGGSIAHDVSVPVSRIAQFIERADRALAAAYPGIRPCAFGHVGDGNVHYNPVRPRTWDWPRFRAERAAINRIVHDIVDELGGSISAEHGIGRARVLELERYKAPVELALMRSIKRAVDPSGIMNPGKVLRL